MQDKNFENIQRSKITKTRFERILNEWFSNSSNKVKEKYFFTDKEINFGFAFRNKYPLVFDGLFKKWVDTGDIKIREVGVS